MGHAPFHLVLFIMKGESVAVFGQTCNAQLLKKTNTPTIALRFIRFVAANIGIDAELLAE